MPKFRDHFSAQAGAYSIFRPLYPVELYPYLSGLCPGHNLAWDCATGNGQAARGLADRFRHIVATDGSGEQVSHASGPDNISFRVATAERSGLETASIDLITVAQALHWFDLDAFFHEAKRVLKPGGILAAWSYNLLEIDEEIDGLVGHLCDDIVGDYWPPERQIVNDNYLTIDFPLSEIAVPPFRMTALWSLDDLVGYLGTWSSVMRYRAAKGRDPLRDIYDDLRAAWGRDSREKRQVCWPLNFRVGRIQEGC